MSDDHQKKKNKEKRRIRTTTTTTTTTTNSTSNKRVTECFTKVEQDERNTITSIIQAEENVQPDAIPSSASRRSMAAPAPTTRSSKLVQRPVAFVEKDFLVNQDPEEKAEEGEREARMAPLPETVTSGDAAFTGSGAEQKTTKEQYNESNNNNGVIIKNEDSLTSDNNDTNNNQQKRRKQGSTMTPIKSEEEIENNDGANSTKRSRRSRRKRKEHPSEGRDFINSNDNLQTNKKKRNKNHQGGKPAVVKNTNRRTSPRNKKQRQGDGRDQKGTINSTTIDKSEYCTDNETNCCRFCNNPYLEKKIYYKCGTVISKYFPKSNNNLNPGWYKGTIRMHHVSSSNSGSERDYEDKEELNSSSEEENEQQSIILNEIHYEDGDMEKITQNDLKLQLMDGGRVKVLHSTKMTTTSSSECHNRVDNASPPTLSDNAHDRKWLEKYQKLQQFKKENGHCGVPTRYGSDPSLGYWVHLQRTLYKKGNLAPNREAKLVNIEFEWDLQAATFVQQWDEAYGRLKKFKAENGHCRVPAIYGPDPSLGKWVKWQRYRKGKLAKDRVEKLDKIGFDWNPGSKTSDQAWLKMYDSLTQFKEENDHCRVPKNYGPDPSLANWVMTQRITYKQRKLAEDRVEKLNKIGFGWDPHNQTWDEMCSRLKEFMEENGHCRVPKNYGPDASLPNWVCDQRRDYKKGIMAHDRVEKLNKIGFDWNPYNQTWDEMFGRLEQFKTDNGHCRVPTKYGPDPSLGNWVGQQRQHYKKGKLAKDRATKLEEIGFDWNPPNPRNRAVNSFRL